ncbi:hypothetical protein AJ78_08679 [Emergomyces pasteurianus Ep9510]|uniref:Peptidase A1 domain-containing protein n=1 Tax=Emergomyces pasteurianus Ep9510 TaxID=1447872 RepID=A0A1J9PQV1_9EURO|nr:hypothetical protein AJ78_08679 [Emergomyces pasteurianus Ep9510]
MRGAVTLCTLSTALLFLCPAINAINAINVIQPNVKESSSVVRFDLQRRVVHNPVNRNHKRLRKRHKKYIQDKMNNEGTQYVLEIGLGTPPQTLTLQVDTGSSDLWVNAVNTTFSEQMLNPWAHGGTYDPDASSTVQYISSNFKIEYFDGAGATGDFLTDTLTIGNKKVQNVQFGVGYQSRSNQGVMGLGFLANEVEVAVKHRDPYLNLPFALKEAGLIACACYSLWLNTMDSSHGVVLFGGIDVEKYDGTLEPVALLRTEGDTIRQFSVKLAWLEIETESGTKDMGAGFLPTAVVLDIGTSVTYLPDIVVEGIYEELGVVKEETDLDLIKCSLKDSDITFIFYFDGATIEVPVRDFIINTAPGPDGEPIRFDDGEPICFFGIAPAGPRPSILGITFLRSTYILYDLESTDVLIAQARRGATGEKITAIHSSPPPPKNPTSRRSLAPSSRMHSKALAMRPDMHLAALVGLAGAMFAVM